MEIILLSDNDLVKNTPLGGNIDVDKYVFCIQEAQLSKLIEILGEDLYEKIKTDFNTNTLSGLYLTLYNRIKPFLIRQSAVEYLQIGAYTVGNGGIYKHTPDNGSPLDKSDIDVLVNNEKNKADKYQKRLQDWLCKFGSGIPEYKCEADNIVNPKNGKIGGWYF